MDDPKTNAKIVELGYAAFNTADVFTLAKLFDPSASWHTPGNSFIAGDFEGREAVFTQLGRYGGETGGSFKAILQEVLGGDHGRVVGLHHYTAQRGSKQLDTYGCTVFEIKDGRVVDGREYVYDQHNWDEFWS